MLNRLEVVEKRYEELNQLMAQPEVAAGSWDPVLRQHQGVPQHARSK